jgi:hypothetical protein
MYGTMDMEISTLRREDALREPTTPRSSSAVIRELARAAGLVRKTFSTPKSATDRG